MTTTNTTPPLAKPRRWIPIALLISGVLNLLLIGLGVGHWYHHRDMMAAGDGGPVTGRTFSGGPGEHGFERVLQYVPADQRDEVRGAMRKLRESRQANFEKLQMLRSDVDTALTTEPFDRAKVEAAYAALRKQGAAMQDSSQNALIDIVAKLPLEARQKMAEFRRPGAWRQGEHRRPQ